MPFMRWATSSPIGNPITSFSAGPHGYNIAAITKAIRLILAGARFNRHQPRSDWAGRRGLKNEEISWTKLLMEDEIIRKRQMKKELG